MTNKGWKRERERERTDVNQFKAERETKECATKTTLAGGLLAYNRQQTTTDPLGRPLPQPPPSTIRKGDRVGDAASSCHFQHSCTLREDICREHWRPPRELTFINDQSRGVSCIEGRQTGLMLTLSWDALLECHFEREVSLESPFRTYGVHRPSRFV